MNVSNKPKPFILTLIGIALLGIPLTLFSLQQQQIFQQYAWSTQQTAVAKCSTDDGSAVIIVTFANSEPSKDINVTADDLQTGSSVDLGTVKHQEVKSANIVTGKSSLANGSVLFHLTWSDGSSGTDQLSATYQAVSDCPVTSNFCPDNTQINQGTCNWDALPGAKGYKVVVKESDTGDIVQSVSVDKNATESAFPMIPGKPYTCTVTPTNECGGGTPATSPVKTCQGPTPTPTPPVCQNGTSPSGVCRWDSVSSATSYNVTVTDLTTGQTVSSDTVQAPTTEFSFTDNGVDTYLCNVTANNICGNSPPAKSPPSTCLSPTPTPGTTVTPTPMVSVSPTPTPKPTVTPTPTPLPTATPVPPTATPKPLPTPTPIVVIITQPPQHVIITGPPQRIVITQPPQQTIVRVPGQTRTIVQQGPPQTIIAQQPPAQTVVQPTARPYSPVTPVPTVMATGNTTPTFVLIGTSVILLLAGGVVFFLL